MRVISCLFIFCYSFSANALFQQIYTGYKNSDRLKEIVIQKEINQYSTLFQLDKYDWNLDLSATNKDASLNSLFSFQAQQTISTTYSVGLIKNSFKYGNLGLFHKRINYDISNWSSSGVNAFTDDLVYEVRNQLTYSYEFLKQTSTVEFDEISTNQKVNNVSQNIQTEKDHYDFFVTYINAKLRILLDQLNLESKERAAKRVSQVAKRVRDGLSRSVELKQAKLALLGQEEQIIQNRNALREKVAIIEHIIKAPIPPAEYKRLSWSFKQKDSFLYLFENQNFEELKTLEYQKELLDLSLLKQDQLAGHSLNLELSYTKNAVNNNESDAFSDAINENRDEKIIALNYTIPLGLDKRDALKQQSLSQKNQIQLKLKNRKSELEIQDKVLGENINRLETSIQISRKKVNLAKQVVSETQKFYLRGQSSFEETIRAEEAYISAKTSEANFLALYEGALAQKAFINGKIKTFLAGYAD